MERELETRLYFCAHERFYHCSIQQGDKCLETIHFALLCFLPQSAKHPNAPTNLVSTEYFPSGAFKLFSFSLTFLSSSNTLSHNHTYEMLNDAKFCWQILLWPLHLCTFQCRNKGITNHLEEIKLHYAISKSCRRSIGFGFLTLMLHCMMFHHPGTLKLQQQHQMIWSLGKCGLP